MAWKTCKHCEEVYNDKLQPHNCSISPQKIGNGFSEKSLRFGEERRKRVIDLKNKEGWSFRKIGKYFGVSGQRAQVIYHLPEDYYEKMTRRKREALGFYCGKED